MLDNGHFISIITLMVWKNQETFDCIILIFRFVGRSWRNLARGPGGIVTESPQAFFDKEDAPQLDFSHTVNMLTVLAKVSSTLIFSRSCSSKPLLYVLK